jgi:hypothetical protein
LRPAGRLKYDIEDVGSLFQIFHQIQLANLANLAIVRIGGGLAELQELSTAVLFATYRPIEVTTVGFLILSDSTPKIECIAIVY